MENHWQIGISHLNQRSQILLNSGQFSDCEFLVGPTDNQRLFPAHRSYLAMASPVFQRMLFGDLAEKKFPIAIPDMEPDRFQTMLEFIYTDRIAIGSFDEACDLFYAANKYILPHVFLGECRKAFKTNLWPQNACRGYEFGKMFDDAELVNESMKIITTATTVVLTDPSFNDIQMTTLLQIFDQSNLRINSEIELYNALSKYAKRNMQLECKTQKPIDEKEEEVKQDPDTVVCEIQHKVEPFEGLPFRDRDEFESSAGNAACNKSGENKVDKRYIMQALKKIRFLTLSPHEFADEMEDFSLFELDEAWKILINLSSRTSKKWPMPHGFSLEMTNRNQAQSNQNRRN